MQRWPALSAGSFALKIGIFDSHRKTGPGWADPTRTNGVIYMEVCNRMAPAQCTGMEEIRQEIDALDQAIIKLLGKRFQYVLAASKFKTSATSVRAPERFKAMLATRREWAEAEGLSPDAIEKMYSDLVNYFIAEELKHWAAQQPQA